MKKAKRVPVRRPVSVCAAAVLVAAMATAAYAADVGGIQRTIQIWVHGDQTSAILQVEHGSYQLTYEGSGGDMEQLAGGGVAIGDDGSERPLSEGEIIDHLNMPQVEYREDGTVWVYYRGQQLDITDRFEDGISYVQIQDGSEIFYLTVEYQGGYTISPHGYENP